MKDLDGAMLDALIFGWSWPSVQEWRDFVIVLYGIVGIIAFLIFILVMFFIFLILRSIRGSLRDLIEDPVRPTLEEVRKTAQNVRGTTEFVADNAVSPVIRVVAAARGIRRGITSIASIRSRRD